MPADFTALNQAVTDLQNEVAAVVSNMDKLMTDLENALAAGNPAAIDAATTGIEAQVQALKDAVAKDTAP